MERVEAVEDDGGTQGRGPQEPGHDEPATAGGDGAAAEESSKESDETADVDGGGGAGAAAEEQEAGEGATPTLAEVLLAVEELWPESLAEDWDKVGLVTGRPQSPVARIMFAVDPTLEVIEEAVAWEADLLITHHPLLLKGVNSVAATSSKGQAVHTLIESGCALLTVHTNGDSAVGGVSDVLADALGLEEVQPLMPAALGLPEEGIGRVGVLASVETLGDFAQRVFEMLPAVASGVRVAGDSDGLVRRVAVCGGSGDSLFDAVRASGADVYVTADLRHHPASEARESALNGRPYLVDLSHWASEWLWLPVAAQGLENVLADQGYAVEMAVSQTNSDPWDFILTPGLGG
ncbi:Nif3-like dinuclear metal center hexameric protein [Arthrobacter sp. 35W]|uniref:Nif3-like dinuclear metal center hexameric protein n=1 Tax=Arthrobacter sp. 35W TaxID=1132441 RepID=UPI0009DF8C13|nr:Nif3-like dinuclear metal center hexameric protein [Arthrobacter sp. 35W]